MTDTRINELLLDLINRFQSQHVYRLLFLNGDVDALTYDFEADSSVIFYRQPFTRSLDTVRLLVDAMPDTHGENLGEYWENLLRLENDCQPCTLISSPRDHCRALLYSLAYVWEDDAIEDELRNLFYRIDP